MWLFNCESLGDLALPPKLEHIGRGALNGCGMRSAIAVPKTVRSMRDYAFPDTSTVMLLAVRQAIYYG